MADQDKRRYPRVALSKAARAKSRGFELDVELRDISASGASLAGSTGLAANAEIGLAIDGIDREISGHVVRAFDDGVAIEFEL
ncbi:MAG: PilZ domain-containing protein, partial [Rhodospirillales bacterium]